jgi:iron-sulfur cluster insertion protein
MEFTLPKVNEEVITISPEATQAVLDIMNEKNLKEHALRIYVAGSSCSGVQFGMALDDNINTTDTTIEAEGLKIIVDHQSIEYARGATVEFINDPEKGTGFVISNPNAQSGGCGCGSGAGEASGCGCDDGQGHSHGGGGGCGCGH